MSGHFVDSLDKLRRDVQYTSGVPSVSDSVVKVIDGFRLQPLYQGLEARIRNSRKNPNLGKLVDIAQAKIQMTRVALDQAGR